jgi:7-carboxy-7-deazaguanine synthase
VGVVDSVTTLPLAEVFGPTVQGEGPHAGRRVGFVRLGMCNLSCAWCDTPYTWDRSQFDIEQECPDTTVLDIHNSLAGLGVSAVVLTGGEPLIHHRHLAELMERRWEWHVETNGTIAPPEWWSDRVAHTSVSPKLGTRDPLRRRIKLDALRRWADTTGTVFKFVCREASQLSEVDLLSRTIGVTPDRVWIMPEGTTTEVILARHRELIPSILDRGYNTTTRLHTLLWDDRRGV